jgi:hypothetical protein
MSRNVYQRQAIVQIMCVTGGESATLDCSRKEHCGATPHHSPRLRRDAFRNCDVMKIIREFLATF